MDEMKNASPLARLVLCMICVAVAGSIVAGVHYFAVDLPQQQNLQAPENTDDYYSYGWLSAVWGCEDHQYRLKCEKVNGCTYSELTTIHMTDPSTQYSCSRAKVPSILD